MKRNKGVIFRPGTLAPVNEMLPYENSEIDKNKRILYLYADEAQKTYTNYDKTLSRGNVTRVELSKLVIDTGESALSVGSQQNLIISLSSENMGTKALAVGRDGVNQFAGNPGLHAVDSSAIVWLDFDASASPTQHYMEFNPPVIMAQSANGFIDLGNLKLTLKEGNGSLYSDLSFAQIWLNVYLYQNI